LKASKDWPENAPLPMRSPQGEREGKFRANWFRTFWAEEAHFHRRLLINLPMLKAIGGTNGCVA
jgi:hypothetical protein